MVNYISKKVLKKGTKADGSALGSKEYPLCKDALMLINVLRKGVDESSLYYVKDAFRGFSFKMQSQMAFIIAKSLALRLDGINEVGMTGVYHVDMLIREIMHKMDHDTKNLEYNEY
jgi:hypothetical protein